MSLKAAIRSVKNTVMQFSEIEIKVREATNNDKWGVSTSQMAEIARATNDYLEYPKLFAMLWKRLNDVEHVMHVQKALILVEYLLRNGAERFIIDAKRRARDIAMLKKYKHYDENNNDNAREARAKAKIVYDMLMDDAKLAEERSKAMKMRDVKLSGFGSEGGGGGYGGGGAYGGGAYGGGGYGGDEYNYGNNNGYDENKYNTAPAKSIPDDPFASSGGQSTVPEEGEKKKKKKEKEGENGEKKKKKKHHDESAPAPADPFGAPAPFTTPATPARDPFAHAPSSSFSHSTTPAPLTSSPEKESKKEKKKKHKKDKAAPVAPTDTTPTNMTSPKNVNLYDLSTIAKPQINGEIDILTGFDVGVNPNGSLVDMFAQQSFAEEDSFHSSPEKSNNRSPPFGASDTPFDPLGRSPEELQALRQEEEAKNRPQPLDTWGVANDFVNFDNIAKSPPPKKVERKDEGVTMSMMRSMQPLGGPAESQPGPGHSRVSSVTPSYPTMQYGYGMQPMMAPGMMMPGMGAPMLAIMPPGMSGMGVPAAAPLMLMPPGAGPGVAPAYPGSAPGFADPNALPFAAPSTGFSRRQPSQSFNPSKPIIFDPVPERKADAIAAQQQQQQQKGWNSRYHHAGGAR